jgi:hypothetical protein
MDLPHPAHQQDRPSWHHKAGIRLTRWISDPVGPPMSHAGYF